MLCERGRDTEAKVKWPKRRIHVPPDKVGNYTLHKQGPRARWNRPLSSNHRQGNVEISLFPRSKRAACAHTNTACERESAIRGMFAIEISVFVGFEAVCVCVYFCDTICR